jgi:very-short-patch-repair endonuclease
VPGYGKVVSPGAAREKVEQARRMRRAPTPAEATLWQALRGNRLGGLHFRRQQLIAGLIVDLYCHAAMLAIEVDGPIHGERAEYDAERDLILSGEGVRVLRLANDDVLQRFARDAGEDRRSLRRAGHLSLPR